MNDVTKDLLGALRALVDSHWLEDSHAVDFDGTVFFGQYYDFSGIDGYRRAEFRDEAIEFVVWPAGSASGKWSAYSTWDGSLWFERFDSEDEARAVCMKKLVRVMPDHPVSRAVAAIARAEAALAEPQPDADGPWKNAVIEQLVVAHILTAEHESDPLKAIQDLLAYHADIAVDPRVSGAAAKLVEQAKAEEREACAHEGWMAASWDCEDRVKAAILARGQK